MKKIYSAATVEVFAMCSLLANERIQHLKYIEKEECIV